VSASGTLLLFVGGDPSLAEGLRHFPRAIPLLAGFLIPPSLLLEGSSSRRPSARDATLLIPADQVMAVERLGDAVKGSPRTVRVVDVNRPGNDRYLVEGLVGPQDVLPILVRPDGARLEGAESFSPAALRKFVSVG